MTPRVADLGEGHRVVSVNALDAIERLLREDPGVAALTIAKSEEWKKGEKWKKTQGLATGFRKSILEHMCTA